MNSSPSFFLHQFLQWNVNPLPPICCVYAAKFSSFLRNINIYNGKLTFFPLWAPLVPSGLPSQLFLKPLIFLSKTNVFQLSGLCLGRGRGLQFFVHFHKISIFTMVNWPFSSLWAALAPLGCHTSSSWNLWFSVVKHMFSNFQASAWGGGGD